MRTIAIAAAVAVALSAGAFASAFNANAGYHHYTLCWTDWSGGSNCRTLPRNYRVPGVAKPLPKNGSVSFTLTRSRIWCLRQWVNTADMRPAQRATIYAPKS